MILNSSKLHQNKSITPVFLRVYGISNVISNKRNERNSFQYVITIVYHLNWFNDFEVIF